MASDTLITAPERPALSHKPDSRRTYSCPECGQVLRWSGLGRHRVYFELGDSRLDDPVMNRVCPMCGYGLPGKSHQPIASLEHTFGLRLVGPEDLRNELPYATGVSITSPEPGARS